MRSKGFCEWVEDEFGSWVTDCDSVFEIINGTPRENGMFFCCFCGRQIIQMEFTDNEQAVTIVSKGK